MSAHPHPGGDSANSVDELVLVVHGVGDPQPGETLSLFARSVAESGYPLTEHQETLWLEDESSSPRDVKTFGTHVRHLEFDGNRSTLAEVFWGDLSRVHRGLFGALSGLLQIVFGLRYVAFVAGHQKGFAARALQWLGLTSSRLLHGPVLAVNFVLAVLVLGVAGTESLWPGSSQVSRWASTLVLGCVFICLISSYLGWRLTRNRVCHRFWYWVMITALFLNGLMLFSMYSRTYLPLVDYCNIMVTMLGAQWIALVLTLVVMTVCWAVAVFQPNTYRPALHVAFILPAMAVGIWGQALPLMWVTGSTSIMKVLPATSAGDQTVAPDRDLTQAGHNHAAGPGPANGATPDDEVAKMASAGQTIRAQFATMFDKAVPLIGVQCIMFLFLGVVVIVQLARYMRWSEKSRIADYLAGSRPPRLIVNEVVQVCLVACTLTGMALVLYVGTHEFYYTHSHKENWLCRLLVEANKYAVGVMVPIGGLLLLSMHLMRPALDIILDVTSHFYFRSATTADRIRGFGEDFDIDDVTFGGGELYYSQRDVIHRRIKRILDYYHATLPGNPTLTIVSHSQGTMIAIEVLNDEELDWVTRKFKQVNFITMGSPFHHIYQRYFRHFYPPLDDDHWTRLRNRVSRWLNIFRIDDFVGTDIEFPQDLPQAKSGAYSNLAVERKGHMLYWSDRQVLSIIRDHDICRSLSSRSRLSLHRQGDAA